VLGWILGILGIWGMRLTLADEDGNESSRELGLLVARGTLLVLISPIDGKEEIANPFLNPDDDP